MTFRVGMKVVCVDASNRSGKKWKADIPVRGAVYTVVGLLDFEAPCLLLAEIRNTPRWEGTYLASRFRPVVERKTSIEIFQQMLNPSKVEANA